MNNQSQIEFQFFSPTARGGGRGQRFVRGKTTNTLRGHAAGWQGKPSKSRLQRTKADVFVFLLLFSFLTSGSEFFGVIYPLNDLAGSLVGFKILYTLCTVLAPLIML